MTKIVLYEKEVVGFRPMGKKLQVNGYVATEPGR